MKAKEIKEKITEGWIHIRVIQEVVGWPKEFSENTLDRFNDALSKAGGVILLEREVHEAKLINEKMWSTFAELELLVNDIDKVLLMITTFMPSSVEIIAPKSVSMDANNLSGALNDLIGKLHLQDSNVKKLVAVRNVLTRKLKAATSGETDGEDSESEKTS